MSALASPCAEAIAARLLVEKLRAENAALMKERDELKTAIEVYRIGIRAGIQGYADSKKPPNAGG